MHVQILTQSHLKELMHYDPESGLFTWRKRPINNWSCHAKARSWNTRYAGNAVGCANALGYISVSVYKKRYLAHRLAFLYMEGKFPPNEVDHKDHCRSNNSWSNLRHATSSQNSRNSSKLSNNKSGFNGVLWNPISKSWRVRIKLVNEKTIEIGSFKNKSDAISARINANIKYGFHANHGH